MEMKGLREMKGQGGTRRELKALKTEADRQTHRQKKEEGRVRRRHGH